MARNPVTNRHAIQIRFTSQRVNHRDGALTRFSRPVPRLGASLEHFEKVAQMPVIRINAHAGQPRLHGSLQPAGPALRHACKGTGPVIVMIHGYKYSPDALATCPHSTLFDLHSGWPAALGIDQNSANGLAIAFGWHARGSLWAAHRAAKDAGRALARALSHVPSHRPIHIIAHSLGSEVALHTLHHLPANSVGRVILLTGASYQSRALAALNTPSGKTAQLINVTTRQNTAFDLMFQTLVAPGVRHDRPLGRGIDAGNATNLALDCPQTQTQLARLGMPIAPCTRRVSHWSVYTRPGAMALYQSIMRDAVDFPLDLPPNPALQRTLAWPRLPHLPLPPSQKA